MRGTDGWGSMTRVIERADQLVLEYVSKVADAAHGVLRTEQRLDFVRRLRDRIEEERRGSDDPAAVRRVLGRFGDPAVLLRREIDRLTASGQPLAAAAARSLPAARLTSARPSRGLAVTAHSSDDPPPGTGGARPADGAKAVTPQAGEPEVTTDDFGDAATQVIPVVDDGASAEGPPTAVQPPVPSEPDQGRSEAKGSAMESDEAGGTDGSGGDGGLDEAEGRMRAGRPPLKGTWGSPPPGKRRAGRVASPGARRVSPLGGGKVPPQGGGRRPLPSATPRMARGAARGPVASGPFGERLRRATGAADGRDVGTVLRHERREVAGMALLVLAGLLIPFPLPYLAIFPAPVLCWALGALVVLASHGWVFADRLTGIAAPIGAYVVGGVVFGAFRSSEEQGTALEAFVTSFFHVSGLMFMFGAVGGVGWLAYRLLNPPPPPPRRSPPGTAR